eukprot:m.152684 g.152684  ORF g.152684 m.152684 type:complete len:257 (-) comp14328_c0_seq2:701-1471(-)
MAGSAAAALEVDDDFSPAVGAYTPVPDTLELADLPPAVYSRGATAEKVSVLKGQHPQGTCLELLRFLKARDGDVDKAAEMYAAHLEWKRRRRPVDEALVRQRFCFCCKGHDTNGNSLVVYHGDRHSKDTDYGKVIDVIVNAVAQAVDRSRTPERKVTLLAFTVAGTPQDRKMWKEVMKALSDNLPETLAHVLVFPTDMFSRALWGIISCFIDPVTARKVHLLRGGRHPDKLPEYVPPECIPTEFGGLDATNYEPLP